MTVPEWAQCLRNAGSSVPQPMTALPAALAQAAQEVEARAARVYFFSLSVFIYFVLF